MQNAVVSRVSADDIQGIRNLVEQGGPHPNQYASLTRALGRIAAASPNHELVRQLRDALAPTLTEQTMQGFAFCKPHGYSGDFEIIDRIYHKWHSPDRQLVKWDEYSHAQAASRAVCNQKEFFLELLRDLELAHDRPVSLLNLGSGPGTELNEHYLSNPDSRLTTNCLDIDPKAIDHAKNICCSFLDRITFTTGNLVRYRAERSYTLIWSAGVFDYFSDRVVVLLLKRLTAWLEPHGELVVGNFSPRNPTRPYMELVGDWHLNCRDEDHLRRLTKRAGIPAHRVRVDSEPLGVNLFLRVSGQA